MMKIMQQMTKTEVMRASGKEDISRLEEAARMRALRVTSASRKERGHRR